jgi:hypothetical protein
MKNARDVVVPMVPALHPFRGRHMFAMNSPIVRRLVIIVAALSVFALTSPSGVAQVKSPPVKTFASPEEAAEAVFEAAKTKDGKSFDAIFGPALREWIVSGDPVQDQEALQKFIDAWQQKHAIAREGDAKAVLTIGNDDFPFPFPIVKSGERWAFDVEAGKEEMLNRRIGENELNTIETLKAVVDAQYEYTALARKLTGLGQYAQRFASTPGKKDGLYWPAKEGELQSPLGPLVAEAHREGYRYRGQLTPYHGYYFRILTAQGPDAPGGAYEYIVSGKMIGGFAVLAYPARYGVSGFKTFTVNHDGVVYETDLGLETAAIAGGIRAFNPDSKWKKL